MFKFNNKHIFTGHLKQVLSSFNLPKNWIDINTAPEVLQTMDKLPWTADYDTNYYYGKYIPNKTKNLVIWNNNYDSYTHEYLGDYLRFQRDYNNLDLMSLYNCFSNVICSRLVLRNDKTPKFNFNTNNTSYKIYMLPVKLFQEYTIAIDSSFPIEVCCCIYGSYQDSNSDNGTRDANVNNLELAKLTYQRFNIMNFSQPQLYTKIKNLFNGSLTTTLIKYILLHQQDIKLFVKIPIENTSSITILEGNYLNYNDSIFKYFESGSYKVLGTNIGKTQWRKLSNHYITNYRPMIEDIESPTGYKEVDYLDDEQGSIFRPISPVQLLKFNTGISYPFSNRLVEYLTDNVITANEENKDNIERLQKIVEWNYISYATGGGSTGKPYKITNKTIEFKLAGVWEARLRPLFYDCIQTGSNGTEQAGTLNTNDINYDCLGYVDKDVEKYYKAIKRDKYGNKIRINSANQRVAADPETGLWPKGSIWAYETISNTDIYPDMYLDSKEDKYGN